MRPAAQGFCVFDVFESEQAVARFNEAMATIPREVGIEGPPEFFPAHTLIELGRVAYGVALWTPPAATP